MRKVPPSESPEPSESGGPIRGGETPEEKIDALLERLNAQDPMAREELYKIVEPEFRRILRRFLRTEGARWRFRTTDLLDETYVKLLGVSSPLKNSVHMYRAASRIMRNCILDIVRQYRAKKRIDTGAALPLEHLAEFFEARDIDVERLEDALRDLKEQDPWLVELVDYLVFGRFTQAEVAKFTKLGVAKVQKDWDFARTWLMKEVQGRGE